MTAGNRQNAWRTLFDFQEQSLLHPLIRNKRADIAALCRRYRVRHLEVIGSAARSHDFDPASSDADFLVEFAPQSDLPPLEEFFGFQADLSRLLERSVDLIEAGAVHNPYVLASINRTRELVYAA